MERCFENLYTPHKVKMGAVGCPRNCAEATVKDIGLVGQEGSWQVVVGGVAGKKVRKADILVTVETTGQALESASLFFQYYREGANYLERTYDFVERVGIEKVRKKPCTPRKQRGTVYSSGFANQRSVPATHGSSAMLFATPLSSYKSSPWRRSSHEQHEKVDSHRVLPRHTTARRPLCESW